MRQFHRSIIKVEVLSEEPYRPDTLREVAFDIMDGNCSGSWSVTESNVILTPVEAAIALREQGSDPEFFNLVVRVEDTDGNLIQEV